MKDAAVETVSKNPCDDASDTYMNYAVERRSTSTEQIRWMTLSPLTTIEMHTE
jgi:hypothetical protein